MKPSGGNAATACTAMAAAACTAVAAWLMAWLGMSLALGLARS